MTLTVIYNIYEFDVSARVFGELIKHRPNNKSLDAVVLSACSTIRVVQRKWLTPAYIHKVDDIPANRPTQQDGK